MEMRCHNCDAPVGGEQAFCPKCGAVLGMVSTGSHRDEDELTATVIGQKLPSKPPPRPVTAPRAAYTPQAAHAGTAPTQASRGGNTVRLAIIGFVAVLLIGGLLLLLLYLNSQG